MVSCSAPRPLHHCMERARETPSSKLRSNSVTTNCKKRSFVSLPIKENALLCTPQHAPVQAGREGVTRPKSRVKACPVQGREHAWDVLTNPTQEGSETIVDVTTCDILDRTVWVWHWVVGGTG